MDFREADSWIREGRIQEGANSGRGGFGKDTLTRGRLAGEDEWRQTHAGRIHMRRIRADQPGDEHGAAQPDADEPGAAQVREEDTAHQFRRDGKRRE